MEFQGKALKALFRSISDRLARDPHPSDDLGRKVIYHPVLMGTLQSGVLDWVRSHVLAFWLANRYQKINFAPIQQTG